MTAKNIVGPGYVPREGDVLLDQDDDNQILGFVDVVEDGVVHWWTYWFSTSVPEWDSDGWELEVDTFGTLASEPHELIGNLYDLPGGAG